MSEASPASPTLVRPPALSEATSHFSEVQLAEIQITAVIESPTSYTLEYLQAMPEEQAEAIKIVAEAMQEPAVIELQQPLYDLQDWETLDHSTRGSVAAVIIGRRFGLDDKDLRILAESGLVHDIGKADPEIQAWVSSSEKFEGSARQRFHELRNRHPYLSADQIMATDAWEATHKVRVANVARGHHAFKTHDAYGQRPGADLELARIFALADTLDGEASARPYKPIFSEAKTRNLLVQDFDAEPEFITRAMEPKLTIPLSVAA